MDIDPNNIIFEVMTSRSALLYNDFSLVIGMYIYIYILVQPILQCSLASIWLQLVLAPL